MKANTKGIEYGTVLKLKYKGEKTYILNNMLFKSFADYFHFRCLAGGLV